MNESPTALALRRGAETASVCRCVGNAIRQPGGCFTCGKPRTAPQKPELPPVQTYVPPERQPLLDSGLHIPHPIRDYASGV